ncbi:MAG: 2-dehydro-3-deoxy-6-phosphogalactonate aldolase [Woeseiaceae bacterium]
MTDKVRIEFLSRLGVAPFVAMLRGVQHGEVVEIAEALVSTGISLIEITVDSPEPYKSMEKLALRVSDRVMICAGNVLTPGQATDAANAGGRVIFSPIFNATVVEASKEKRALSVPGVFTATEAASALDAGADALRIFPADSFSTKGLHALRKVLPDDTIYLPSGGITAHKVKSWMAAGAAGFGLGTSLYTPGATPEEVQDRARVFTQILVRDDA